MSIRPWRPSRGRPSPSSSLIAASALTPREVLRRAARAAGVGKRLVMLSPYERRSFGSPAEAGFDGYLVKPVRPRSLFARLGESAPAEAETIPSQATEDPAAAGAPDRSPGRGQPINALLARKTAGEGRRRGHRRDRRRSGPRRRALGAQDGSGPPSTRPFWMSGCPGWDGKTVVERISDRRRTGAEPPAPPRRGRDGQCLLRGSVRLPRCRLRRFRAEADRPQGDRRGFGRAPAGKCRAGEGGLSKHRPLDMTFPRHISVSNPGQASIGKRNGA